MHDETYRMLGREHEADLERDARKWQRAAEVRGSRRNRVGGWFTTQARQLGRFAGTRLASFLLRLARAEG